jgi:Na+-transporting methylmalonyl-CoA/oxaloacetate decarboxylase gamma subunit
MGERMKTVLAWLVVLIPAVWGVSQVVSKSAALFK